VFDKYKINESMEIKPQFQILKDDPYLQPYEVLPRLTRNITIKYGSSSTNGCLIFEHRMASTDSARATSDTDCTNEEMSGSTRSGLHRPEASPSSENLITGKEASSSAKRYPYP
jgi:hypothetical protein